jgi:fumarate reductase subunit C
MQHLKKIKYKDKKMGEEMIIKKDFAELRVIQRNLVYIIGVPLSIADEELLKSDAYFGQYGKILKILVNKKYVRNTNMPQEATVSCYVTYVYAKDARKAIQAIDGIYLDHCLLRASYGTTKYCAFYLRNMSCPNKRCMYLHEPGDQEESFTREELLSG